MTKPKMVWMPRSVLEEVNSIMEEEQIKKQAEALHRLAIYAQMGREYRKSVSANKITVNNLFKKKKRGDWF